jgi:hypothetical protein
MTILFHPVLMILGHPGSWLLLNWYVVFSNLALSVGFVRLDLRPLNPAGVT